MTPESLSDFRCKCGGRLIRRRTEVEFFGIDFGVRQADVCIECGSEYISQELMEEIEAEVKRRGLFGLERRGHVAKSGNSLVIRIPKEISKTLKIKRDTPITIYPSERNRLIVEFES